MVALGHARRCTRMDGILARIVRKCDGVMHGHGQPCMPMEVEVVSREGIANAILGQKYGHNSIYRQIYRRK
jgi:hypothetical protein